MELCAVGVARRRHCTGGGAYCEVTCPEWEENRVVKTGCGMLSPGRTCQTG